MEFRRLQYFVCVAEVGSLAQASNTLHIAQPALTRQIRLLEQSMGALLFVRSRRGMRLTTAGQRLYDEVVGPLRQLESALLNLRSSVDSGGSINLGMSQITAYFLAQPLIERAAKCAPKISLRVVEGTVAHINEWLNSGEIDMALLYERPQNVKLHVVELLEEDLFLIGAKSARLSKKRVVSLKELSELTILVPSMPGDMVALTKSRCVETSLNFQVREGFDSFSALRDMVVKGLGYTLLPLSTIVKDIEYGTLTYARTEKALKSTLIMTSKSRSLNARATAGMARIVQGLILDLHDQKKIFGNLKF